MFDKMKDVVSNVAGDKDLGSLNLGGYERYLEGISFPASKDEILAALQSNNVDEGLINQISGMNQDTFNSPLDLLSGLLNR
jgi:hypothetical protein